VSAIVVEDLVKRYDDFTAVEDVSFTAAAGKVTALLGPNGAGKTTTIEILEGFQAPTAGTVRVLGTDPLAGGKAGRAWRARIGLVLQSTSLDAQLTVTEALALFGGLYPGRRRVGEVLDVIDMAADARTRIGALSGGQRRRVDLGIAIIGQPEMLFRGELRMPSADVTADLTTLTGWARANHVDLTGLEVGSPSLEDAYLALTQEGAGESWLTRG
jgi:ABC-2 type transport system ATP-binding protein